MEYISIIANKNGILFNNVSAQMGIHLRLRQLRELKNLTSKEFSSKIGVDSSQYSKVERGVLMPTINMLLEIYSIFEVSTDWLLTGNGDMLRSGSIDVEEPKKIYDIDKNNGSPLLIEKDKRIKALEKVIEVQDGYINELKKRVNVQEDDNAGCADASGVTA